MNDTTANARETKNEVRGTVLDVLRELLAGGRDDEALAVVAKLVSRNEELERMLAKVRESKNKKEGISREQLDLFLDHLQKAVDGELDEASQKLEDATQKNGGAPPKTKPAKQPPVRRPPPPNARRVDNPIPVPAEQRPCPKCGGERTCISHDTTEVIDLIPAEVIVRLDHREVLACMKCEGELERAPLGDKVVPGGVYGARLVSKLVIGKYDDGMPLERQRQELERLGLSLPSASMSDQIRWATDLLRPVWRHLLAKVLGALVMHLDSTSLPVRDNESPKGIVIGALWGYVGDETHAVYLYTSTGKKLGQREGELGPEEVLAMRHGFTVADASSLFDQSFKNPNLIEVGCNMHGRRYFVKALDAGDMRAALAVDAFKALYDIEESVRGQPPDRKLEQRQRRSKPVYDQLLSWCRTHQPVEPPSSLLGRAMGYLINHHLALMRFLDDGRLPIDNGIVERLHRRPAVGRRSFLFAGSHAGGERAAIAYSVLASCRLAGVNPAEYLPDVLPRLARGVVPERDVPAMLPAAWKAARPKIPAVEAPPVSPT